MILSLQSKKPPSSNAFVLVKGQAAILKGEGFKHTGIVRSSIWFMLLQDPNDS